MPSIRTQIYLTAEQRERIDAVMKKEGKPMAEIIREAIEAYVSKPEEDPLVVARETYGSIPNLKVPSRKEWDRRV